MTGETKEIPRVDRSSDPPSSPGYEPKSTEKKSTFSQQSHLSDVIRAANATSNRTKSDNINIMQQIAEVSEGLLLCSARAVNAERLQEHGVTCVVNAASELPTLPLPDTIEYVKVNVEDSPYANLYGYFDAVADKIAEVKRKSGKTLVHCIAGISRSASLCIAYLMKYEKMSLRTAFTHLKSRRHIIRPNQGFFRQLIDYERRLFGQESVSMVHNSAIGMLIPDVYEVDYENMVWFQQHYNRNLGRH